MAHGLTRVANYVDKDGADVPRLKTPDVGPRKDAGKMADEELHRLVDGLINSAAQYIREEITPLRALATKYYKGEPFGNEEKGRSQYVSTDVRDGVLATLPPMLRIIFGPERVVEFRPNGPEDVAGAEQATDYVNYVFGEDNNGFLETLGVLKDGLTRKAGFYKWVWDEYTAVKSYHLENLTREQILALAQDEEITITDMTSKGEIPGEPGPDGQPGAPEPIFDVELTRKEKDGKACVYAIPPDEMIWNREARSLDDAIIVAHDTAKSQGEIIAMGVDRKIVEDHGGPIEATPSEEELARNPALVLRDNDEAGEANTKTRFVEAYILLDYDGDGIAELRKIVAIGPELYVVENEPVDERPFAMFCPDPEPHTVLGQSLADRLMDIQKLKSSLFRSTLDSAASALFPRTVYKHGEANLSDILNTAIGAPIRTTGDPNNTVREYGHTFMGKELFPVLQFCDDVIERRTGQNKGAQGLDASALQSSTKTAVAAAVTASQAQQDMLVRIFAEQTLKPLFRGLLKLLVKHQPRSRMIRLRNQWTQVDPRPWNANMDVQVNVMLGAGMVDEKIDTLLMISQKQEQIFATLGPQNPIVTLKQYRDTLAEIAELRGRKDTEKYFQRITDEQLQQMAEQAANAPPPPDPKVQIEQMKLQAQQQNQQAQMQLEIQKVQAEQQLEQLKAQRQLEIEQIRADREHQLESMRAEREHSLESERLSMQRDQIMLEQDRLRDKEAAEIALKRLEIEAKYQAQVNEAQLNAEIERERNTTQQEG